MSRILTAFAACLVLLHSGCGDSSGPPPRTEANTNDRLMALGMAYNRYGKSAKDDAEFRKALEPVDLSQFSRFHIRSIEDMLTSPRDKQTFVIKYGTKPGVPGVSTDVLAYEQLGAQGTRFVLYSTLDIKEVSADEFKKLVPAE